VPEEEVELLDTGVEDTLEEDAGVDVELLDADAGVEVTLLVEALAVTTTHSRLLVISFGLLRAM
jgi:hypothetical protein